ncbi:hypothetical protein [Alicyclobacillus sp. SO9]|uniref:hypothetical protein n=1 Tax=Alicyclobacillus sp. SO9 TaxID=2665646 RepID=UPI0018E762F3|nr:hypothetical protein [Alicyclobacillus sp. SO9]QQE80050.1 hypothetical protein GI364_06170 [Alicyclobacillus sp. SO9]
MSKRDEARLSSDDESTTKTSMGNLAADCRRTSFDVRYADNTVTAFEFLRQQLATGEITLGEYMMICQGITS